MAKIRSASRNARRPAASKRVSAKALPGPIYDTLGNELTTKVGPVDSSSQAEIGRVRDLWAGRTIGEITPQLAARVLRGDADLTQQMLVCKRLVKDPHIFACMRNLVYQVSRLPWDVLPFDESSPASRKQAENTKRFFTGIKRFKKLQRYLMFGEFYPLVGAGLVWNDDFMLDRWIRIDPARWRWDTRDNALRILTNAQPAYGEPLGNRRGYILYQSELEPGSIRELGLWQKCLWLWIFYNTTWAWWVRFAEAYGNPYIWAFFARPEDKESVLDAVLGMDANARGVFPEGTEIKLQEAQRYGTSALYSAIIESAQKGVTKLILGHTLNIDVEPGSGTLAGKGAKDIATENKEGVAENAQETVQEDLLVPFEEFHVGEDAVANGEVSVFSIDASPPDNQDTLSKVFVQINQVAAAAGKVIDPTQVEEKFGVRLVDRPASAAPPVAPPVDGQPVTQRRRRAAAAGAGEARIKTPDDVLAAAKQLVLRGTGDVSRAILEDFNTAGSIEEGIDAIWEHFGAHDIAALGSGLRDTTVVASLQGGADLVTEAES